MITKFIFQPKICDKIQNSILGQKSQIQFFQFSFQF